MVHLHITLTPAQLSAHTGYSGGTLSRVRLIGYKAEGLTSTQSIFFTIRNQNVAQIYGNVHTSYFPLFFDQFPDQLVNLNNPLWVTNNQRWNDAHQLQFDLVDITGVRFTQFTRLFLMFEVDDYPQTQLYSNLDIDLSLQQQ